MEILILCMNAPNSVHIEHEDVVLHLYMFIHINNCEPEGH